MEIPYKFIDGCLVPANEDDKDSVIYKAELANKRRRQLGIGGDGIEYTFKVG